MPIAIEKKEALFLSNSSLQCFSFVKSFGDKENNEKKIQPSDIKSTKTTTTDFVHVMT